MSTGHSPLGASGMPRWGKCPGSVNLIGQLTPAENAQNSSADADRGTAAHELAARCLEARCDAWEMMGQIFNGIIATDEMTNAVQVYLDECNAIIKGAEWWRVEISFANPDVHPDFRGTADFAAVRDGTLYVRDYKHGAGVVVEATSEQLRYYAYAMLLLRPDARRCDIGVVQPNCFHAGGPVRSYVWRTDDLHQWANDTLLPGMQRCASDNSLVPGDHCRFCPVRGVCPVLQGMFEAGALADPNKIQRLPDYQLANEYKMLTANRIYTKAVEDEVYRRLTAGTAISGVKLVARRADRVWKPDAADMLEMIYGPEAYTTPALKSPAQMEKIGPVAKDLVKEYAYTPQAGMTVALATDDRPEIKVTSMAEAFAGVTEDY